jgi:hypothetical protein
VLLLELEEEVVEPSEAKAGIAREKAITPARATEPIFFI